MYRQKGVRRSQAEGGNRVHHEGVFDNLNIDRAEEIAHNR